MINFIKLKQEAKILEDMLIQYKDIEQQAQTCLEALNPILNSIKSDQFSEAYEENPCGYYFLEGELGNYPELEDAYSNFIFTASDGDENELNEFFSQK